MGTETNAVAEEMQGLRSEDASERYTAHIDEDSSNATEDETEDKATSNKVLVPLALPLTDEILGRLGIPDEFKNLCDDPDRNLHGEKPIFMFQMSSKFIPKYFDWTPEELKAIKSQDAEQIGQIIALRLEATGATVLGVYIIIHDKDTEFTKDGREVGKEAHFHIGALFDTIVTKDQRDNAGTALTVKEIAGAIGVAKNMVCKSKSGKYGWDNFLAYLIHAKDEDKWQYSPDEVKTIIGTDYMEIWSENREHWQHGRATKRKKGAKDDADWLDELIDNDVYTKDEILLNDKLRAIYRTNPRRFDQAFDTLGQTKAARAIEALKNGEFKLSFFYLQGESNGGKSTFADALIPKCVEWSEEHKGKPWRVYNGCTSNALDDYHGEEIVLLDEIRATAMKPSAWLSLVNPEKASTLPARYHNRRMAAHVVILTCPQPPATFFVQARRNSGDENDPLDQFLRRLQMLIHPFYLPELDPKTYELMGYGAEAVKQLTAKAGETAAPYGIATTRRLPKGYIGQYTIGASDGANGELQTVRSHYEIVGKDVKDTAPSPLPHNYQHYGRRRTLAEAIAEAMEIVIENNTLQERSKTVEVISNETVDTEDAEPADALELDYDAIIEKAKHMGKTEDDSQSEIVTPLEEEFENIPKKNQQEYKQGYSSVKLYDSKTGKYLGWVSNNVWDAIYALWGDIGTEQIAEKARETGQLHEGDRFDNEPF